MLVGDTISLGTLRGCLAGFGMALPQHESSLWSNTVFDIFRAAYGATLVLIVYQLYQRWKLRRLLDQVPPLFAGAESLAMWTDDLCRSKQEWPRYLLDEVLFLQLAALYVRGRWNEACILARGFPWLRIPLEVQRLFVNRTGEVLFPPSGTWSPGRCPTRTSGCTWGHPIHKPA